MDKDDYFWLGVFGLWWLATAEEEAREENERLEREKDEEGGEDGES